MKECDPFDSGLRSYGEFRDEKGVERKSWRNWKLLKITSGVLVSVSAITGVSALSGCGEDVNSVVGGDENSQRDGNERTDGGSDTPLPSPKGIFLNEAKVRGLTHENIYPSEAFGLGGPGVCTADFDRDSDLDLYFPSEGGSFLYRNDGKGFFENATLDPSENPSGPENPTGCLVFDFNNDRFEDIFATGINDSRLYQNNFPNEGELAFADVTEAMGIDVPGFTWSATAGDIENDGDLDFAIARYRDDDGNGIPNLLFVNHGDEFREEGEERGLGESTGASLPAFSNLFFDFDRDGDIDYYQGNDGGLTFANRFFLNDGMGHFENAAEVLGLDFSENQPPFSQDSADDMGIAVADLNRDGEFLEITIPNYGCRSPLLFECQQIGESPVCQDVSRERGFTDTTHTSWGVILEDFDRDGDTDVFIGSAESIRAASPCDLRDLPALTPPQLAFNQGDGTFSPYLPEENDVLGIAQEMFGSVSGDFDGDGDIDMVVAIQNNTHETEGFDNSPLYLKNVMEFQGNGLFLEILLGNRRAIGATVEVTVEGEGTSLFAIVAGGSFASASSAPLHVGLGEAKEAEISIIWPGGEREEFGNLRANEVHTLDF